MNLFEHFFKVLSLYLEVRIRIRTEVKGRIRIRIHTKGTSRIRIRIKVTSRIRIRIRIKVIQIRNTEAVMARKGSYKMVTGLVFLSTYRGL